MSVQWLKGVRKYLVGTCAALALSAGISRAGDGPDHAQLRALIEQQQKQIEELQQRIDQPTVPVSADGAAPGAPPAAGGAAGKLVIDDDAIKKIIGDYLKENPGAGMPAGTQVGWYPNQGFVIRSDASPRYVNWNDECKIPFEMRFRGRLQVDYYYYNVTDTTNHLTGARTNAGFARPTGTFSQMEIKRGRFEWFGTAFSPNLRWNMQLDGNTRGINALASGGTPATNPVVSNATAIGTFQPGTAIATVDHSVRLFGAYIAYDWRPCCDSPGCGPDCPPDTPRYAPTITGIVGKFKPFFAFEEVMGSGNEQMVEYGMAEWFFDADNDNYQTQAGIQVKAVEDRLFGQFCITNAAESQVANLQNQRIPGFTGGLWFDIGGNWDEQRHRWDLFGDTLSDVDYSCKPVARIGAAYNVWLFDRRSIYGIGDQAIVKAASAAPGGTNFISIFNPAGSLVATNAQSPFGMDSFDVYEAEVFAAGKYRGFSFLTDWFFRSMNNFQSTDASGKGNPIVYSVGGTNYLFNKAALFDYGFNTQCGYFVIPKKLELCARWSQIRGESGDVFGNGKTVGTINLPNQNGTAGTTSVRLLGNAFQNYHESDEFAIGVNYFWKRQLLKWQTDISWYQGGNPASGGSSAAGFISGVDGWMLRSQIQLWF